MDATTPPSIATYEDTDTESLRFLEAEGLDLLAYFKQIDDVKVRQAVMQLVHELSQAKLSRQA